MNNQNLKPFTSVEEARIMGSKGGSSKSPLKSISAKLRWMKRQGINDETIMVLHDMMVSSEAANFEVLKFLLAMKTQAKTLTEREKVAKLLIEWSKTHHSRPGVVNMVQVNNDFPDGFNKAVKEAYLEREGLK